MQQLAASRQAAEAPGLGDQAAEEASLLLEGGDLQQHLLPLLLPGASQGQLAYAAAMLLPFALGSLPVSQLVAAAAECAAVERRLRAQPAAEAARCLRQLAAALGSRSLDLAVAFAGAPGHQLPYLELVSRRQAGRQAATFVPDVATHVQHLLTVLRRYITTCLSCREGCCSGCSQGLQMMRHAACWPCWLHRPALMAAAAAGASAAAAAAPWV